MPTPSTPSRPEVTLAASAPLASTPATSRLTAASRTQAIANMAAQPLDVLVIGGGVTGAGIALDAAARGLRVGIVEAQDWAAGTSSRSSKLVHGGLRYLQMLDFKLVREALRERDLLLTTTAPHLVRGASFIYPLRHRVWERAYVGAGIALYDAFATANKNLRRALPLHRHLGLGAMRKLFPDLREGAAVGGIQYWDATVDDARLVITLLRTAAAHGALAASRTKVVDLLTGDGRIGGAVVEDLESGARHTIHARHVIAATGVWTGDTQERAHVEGGLTVLASKGIHIVVPRERIAGTSGLILQTEKSVLFVIPWRRYWIIGTTDTPYHHEPSNPVVTSADIDYVINHANTVLARPLTRDDVVGTWAGLRPLLQPGTKAGTDSAKISREHTVASPKPGLTVVAGGKLTTYRVMAKDAVDFALASHDAPDSPGTALASATESTVLLGGENLDQARALLAGAAQRWSIDAAMADHLLHRYGSAVSDVLDLMEADPTLGAPLESAPAYLRAEIVYAATAEGALHLEDVLNHRTRLQYEQADAGLGAAQEIAALMAPHLGWDAATQSQEIENYALHVRAVSAASAMSQDADAVAAFDAALAARA